MSKRITGILIGYLLTLLAGLTSASEQPVVVLYERDPWLLVVGSDSPSFTLYEDGKTIYWDEDEGPRGSYKITTLKDIEIKELFISKFEALDKLKGQYNLSDATDQPTQVLAYYKNHSRTKISLYGNLRRDEEVRVKAPKPFVEFFDFIANFDREHSTKWHPTHIEVLVWPYEYAPDESIIWPKEWPDLESELSVGRGGVYSIFLPYRYKDQFVAFINTRKEKGAVLINGKKWAISARLPFPHEEAFNKVMNSTR